MGRLEHGRRGILGPGRPAGLQAYIIIIIIIMTSNMNMCIYIYIYIYSNIYYHYHYYHYHYHHYYCCYYYYYHVMSLAGWQAGRRAGRLVCQPTNWSFRPVAWPSHHVTLCIVSCTQFSLQVGTAKDSSRLMLPWRPLSTCTRISRARLPRDVVLCHVALLSPFHVMLFGWHYLSNATCPMRPHLFYACFVVSRIAIICYILRHF